MINEGDTVKCAPAVGFAWRRGWLCGGQDSGARWWEKRCAEQQQEGARMGRSGPAWDGLPLPCRRRWAGGGQSRQLAIRSDKRIFGTFGPFLPRCATLGRSSSPSAKKTGGKAQNRTKPGVVPEDSHYLLTLAQSYITAAQRDLDSTKFACDEEPRQLRSSAPNRSLSLPLSSNNQQNGQRVWNSMSFLSLY